MKYSADTLHTLWTLAIVELSGAELLQDGQLTVARTNKRTTARLTKLLMASGLTLTDIMIKSAELQHLLIPFQLRTTRRNGPRVLPNGDPRRLAGTQKLEALYARWNRRGTSGLKH